MPKLLPLSSYWLSTYIFTTWSLFDPLPFAVGGRPARSSSVFTLPPVDHQLLSLIAYVDVPHFVFFVFVIGDQIHFVSLNCISRFAFHLFMHLSTQTASYAQHSRHKTTNPFLDKYNNSVLHESRLPSGLFSDFSCLSVVFSIFFLSLISCFPSVV